MSRIIAVNGSSHRGGNIERAMKRILDASEESHEMVHLHRLRIRPCTGCLQCVEENRCAQRDDMNELLEKIVQADALVVGAYPTFSSVNGLTKLFTERMFPLKHRKMLTRGKLAAAVAGGFRDAAEVERYLRHFLNWFRFEVVSVLRLGGNPPCLSCGCGEECAYSNIPLVFGEGARITPDKFYCLEDDREVMLEAERIGKALGSAVRERAALAG
jgi:hypothetical protein